MTLQPNTKIIDDNAISAEAEEFFAADTQTSESTKTASNDSSATVTKKPFPVLSDKALYGLAGDVVKIIEPHTEAAVIALLAQLLAGFGNLIGMTAHFRIGADYHYLKIFLVLVGATARGRKGTSWSEIERVLLRVDESFINCIQNGLSSGEGLIHHVRDEQIASRPIKDRGIITGYQDEIVDAGATEKRAFVIEPEFARVLQVMKREGNTLSSVIRQAWDTDRLRVMTKNPIKATGAHISITGHITDTELIRNLEKTETANGFANRFNWLSVSLSKYLPDGGNLQESDLNGVVSRLQDAARFARNTLELKRDAAASKLWHQVYRRLSDGYGGLLGAVSSRATAQVMRFACLYALLDLSNVIRLEHLQAALALWQYCEDSAKYIFGITSGDKAADEIVAALEKSKDGMSRTEINSLFNRNRSSIDNEATLQVLIEMNRIVKTEEKTGGRPREIFKVLPDDNNELNELSASESQKNRLNSFNSFNSLDKQQTENQCPHCCVEYSRHSDGTPFCQFCFDTK